MEINKRNRKNNETVCKIIIGFCNNWQYLFISIMPERSPTARSKKVNWGIIGDNINVDLYILKNSKGAEMKVTTYGAIVVSLTMPDQHGNYEDIVLGYDKLKGYLNVNSYFGAIVGRYGNRIGKGKFKIDTEFRLTINDGENHLHGGTIGFDKIVWDAESLEVENGCALKLSYKSKDGEQGYPGNLNLIH